MCGSKFANRSRQSFTQVIMLVVMIATLIPTGNVQGKPVNAVLLAAGSVSGAGPAVYRVGQEVLRGLPAPRQAGAVQSKQFSIFGQDDRFQVADTSAYPWSAIALIRIYWSADDLVGTSCTGWMIGPSALATAAHCIYHDGYPDHVIVKPAMNSDTSNQTPFGTCPVIDGVVPQAWIDQRNIEYDYGVYHLGCTIGEKTGTLGFKMTTGDISQRPVQVTGYPNDKPGRTMWSGQGKVTSSSAKGLHYDADMWPGQSGAPVWDPMDKSCAFCVVAINSSAFAAPAKNFGARIDREAFEFLQAERTFRPPQPEK